MMKAASREGGVVPPGSPDDPQRIGQAGGALLFASIIGNGLSYLFLLGLARFLPPADFGTYALGLTIFNCVALATVLGFDTGAIKFVSHYLGLSQHPDDRRVVLQTVWVGGLCATLAALGLALLSQSLAIGLYGNPDLAPVLRGFAWAVPLSVLTTLLLAVLQAFQTVRYTILVKYLWEPAAKIVLTGLCLWAGLGLGGVVGAFVVTLAVSLVWSARAVWHRADLGAGNSLVPSNQGLRDLLAYCVPLGAANLVGIVATRADVLLLGYWREAQEVGIYLVAFQTAAVLTLVAGAFEAVMSPLLSRAHARDDRTALALAYQEGTRLAVTVTTPVVLIIFLFAPDILRLFNPQFAVGGLCLVILAVGQWVNSTTTFANGVLLMGGASRVVMAQTLASGIVLLAAAALLIPGWGILGAALAASGAVIAVNAARLWEVWRRFRVHPWSMGLISPLSAGIGTAIVMLGVKLVFVGAAWPVLAVLCLTVYLTFLVLFGVHHEDRDLVLTLVNKLKPRVI